MAPPKELHRATSQNVPRSAGLVQRIKDIIYQIGVYFKLDNLAVSQLTLKPSTVYMPILQPFEDITFRGPTIGPPSTIESTDVDVWSLPVRTCSMDVHWVFTAQANGNRDLTWKDTITMKFFTNSGPNKEIVELPLSSTPAKTECNGVSLNACSATPVTSRTMTASPQHFYRRSNDEWTFNRDYIQFYYGRSGENEFIAFHTDTNGHAEDNYLIPSRFPSCTVPRQDPADMYSRDWVNEKQTVTGIPSFSHYELWDKHRRFTVRGGPNNGVYYDGDAMMFTCFFPCARISG
ncbi:hypothetical protein TWF506_000252 [Arthrobotrys conoides]|uniref:Uncharacterized protein n=1 Tax=Arthrobotrys conoides TaxID=74498 RepID=A0AAN8NKM2_9PEZI